MDNKALAETYVGLYRYIADNYETQTGVPPKTDVVNMIFEQTCKRIISDLIGKQRQGVPTQQSSSSGEKPTDKQIAFAKKLGCNKPEGFSKKELSAWIEEHKEW